MTDYFFSAPSIRNLSSTKVVPYSPSTAFAALSDVSSYERASSLIYASSVTSKNAGGLPRSAKLNVGYPALALNEEWLCLVKCDRAKRIVEVSKGDHQSSVIESYVMKWTVSPVANDKGQAEIKLDLEVKFKGPMVDSMFAVLPDVAGRIMFRFTALVEAMDKKEREQAKQKAATAKKNVSAAPSKASLPAKPPAVAKAPEAAAAPVKRAPKKLEVRSAGGRQQLAS